ncbi:S-S bond formation pathway protein, partial [Monkeypox virus]
MSWYEKYNIV